MASSYDRIYKLLLDTAEGKELLASIRAKYENARITRHTFELKTHDERGNPMRPYASVVFHTNFHPEATFNRGGTNGNCHLSTWRLAEDADFDIIAKKHFGKEGGVPTFNCQPETVFGTSVDKKKQRGRKDAQSFSSWGRNHVDEIFKEDRLAAEKRLNEEAWAVMYNPGFEVNEAFEAEKKSALVNFCMRDVREVLCKFSFLGDDVLREALREFAVADVLES
jgi:hypothetical protein